MPAKKIVEPVEKLPKNYQPAEHESALYTQWEKGGYFAPKESKKKGKFVIPMPPPNVTGVLHLGHAETLALEDIMVRYHRMRDDETLWIPGTDHAAISTQLVVEEDLKKKGLHKDTLGREKFLEKCWEWKDRCHDIITSQVRLMGASCDWARERFTMDTGLNRAVKRFFVDLYNKGKIYKGHYIVNWCPSCQTAISDIETNYREQNTHLYYIRYFVKAADKSVIVATTRPETMLGDVAVAVNPNDKRYKEFIGKTLILPILNREIPVIADEAVDMNFGTGAVKVTPAHDPVDFQIALRHKLPSILIIGKDGRMNKNSGKFAGLSTLQARENIIQYLDNIGNLEQTEEYTNKISTHERCHSTIEPMVSEQWFVKTDEMAKKALDLYKKGTINIIPSRFGKVYENWLSNLNDWCISRQIWWGHQIPAYYCQKCHNMMVAEEAPAKCTKCKGTNIVQDPDTLDTWFSSGLWPFSTLGWPLKTDDLKRYFPNTVLETGYDIIFFWVARMIMMSLEVFDKAPFQTIYLHGLIRDAQGRKMSKSLGNGIDPVKMVEKYGADALRLSLILGNTPGADLKFSETKVESYRNFMNKLWNASRFILLKSDPPKYSALEKDLLANRSKLGTADKWILSRLTECVREVTKSLEEYRFSETGLALYDFTWGEFCDWYIEISKKSTSKLTPLVLNYVILTLFKLWHPYTPFITETLWGKFGQKKMLISESWPVAHRELEFPDERAEFEQIIEMIKQIRNVRSLHHIEPSAKGAITVDVKDKKGRDLLTKLQPVFELLARVSTIKFGENVAQSEKIVVGRYTVFLHLKDFKTAASEERQEKEIAKLKDFIAQLEKKLADKNYTKKAKPEVVERDKKRLAEEKEKLKKLL